jgi:FixJ family two-component response regulator
VEFFDYLGTDQPDCVILDLHMPGMSGFDIQARLCNEKRTIPVLIITGHDTPKSQHWATSAGAIAYLRKPVDDQVLLDAVNAAIRERKIDFNSPSRDAK